MPTNPATTLPQLDLNEGTIITVTLDDAAAVVQSLTLHGWQELPQGTISPPPVLLAVEAE